MSQLDLFARAKPARASSDLPDPADVRREMLDVLAQLEAAETMPFPQKTLAMWKTIWPQMSRWLPDERDELIRRFDAQVTRLQAS